VAQADCRPEIDADRQLLSGGIEIDPSTNQVSETPRAAAKMSLFMMGASVNQAECVILPHAPRS
jgi:hypothetical protein